MEEGIFQVEKGVREFLNHVILIFCQRYVDGEQKASFFSGKWSEKNIFTVLCFLFCRLWPNLLFCPSFQNSLFKIRYSIF